MMVIKNSSRRAGPQQRRAHGTVSKSVWTCLQHWLRWRRLRRRRKLWLQLRRGVCRTWMNARSQAAMSRHVVEQVVYPLMLLAHQTMRRLYHRC